MHEAFCPASHKKKRNTSCSDDFPYYAYSLTLCHRLEINILVLTVKSAANAPKMQRDMIYKLILNGASFKAPCYTNAVAICVALYATLLT